MNLFYLFLVASSLASNTKDDIQYVECEFLDKKSASEVSHIIKVNQYKQYSTYLVANQEDYDILNELGDCVDVELGPSPTDYKKDKYSTTLGELTDDEFFKEYQSYNNIKNQFKRWAKQYGKYATFHKSIGKSIEGRDIFSFDITDKTYTGEKKEIVYIGGIHAREWISPASVSYISYRLLTDAQSDEQIAEHLKKFIFRIIPLANPDGYEYSRTKDRMWRKNRRDNGDGTFGVDLNRNFPDHWGLAGTTDDTDDETYHGSGPGSEPEVAAIIKYIDSLENPYGAIDWHSYGQKILRSPGWTATPSENDDILAEIADEMIDTFEEFGFKFSQQLSSELYPASGTTDDWLAQDQGLISFTVELCPTEPEEAIGFELPESSLIKCATAAYYSSTTFAQYLLDFPDIPPNKMFS